MTDLRPGITAVIAAHPARLKTGLLTRAIQSVCKQQLQPEVILVHNDKEGLGAGATRRSILTQVNTQWMAWLDSDDYWYPQHLAELYAVVEADPTVRYVFSWFDAAHDPLGHFGKVYDIHNPTHTTITALVDVAMAKEIGFRDTLATGPFSDEDWPFMVGFAKLCIERGYNMVHVPKRTWFWDQSGQNTSGRPDRGDAVSTLN